MIKKNITYISFNGEQVTDSYYFNMTQLDILKMTANLGCDIDEYVQKIVANNDFKGMINLLEEIILGSVGVKSEDGRSFVKNNTIREGFANSIPYSELFSELLTDSSAATDFIKKVVESPLKVAKEKTTAAIIDAPPTVESSEVEELRRKLAAMEAVH